MKEQQSTFANNLALVSHSPLIRGLLIAALLALMAYPISWVTQTLKQKDTHKQQLTQPLVKAWGGSQTLTGPVLSIPYVKHSMVIETTRDAQGIPHTTSKDHSTSHTLMLLPEKLDVNTELKEQHLEKDHVSALAYRANVTLNGHFDLSVLEQQCDKNCTVAWDKAVLTLGMTEPAQLVDVKALQWQTAKVPLKPSTKIPSLLTKGLHAPLTKPKESQADFSVSFSLNGSQGFSVATLGEQSTVKIHSSWPTPQFIGQRAPDTQKASNNGFSGEWDTSNIGRNYPQYWYRSDAQPKLNSFTVGVNLAEPASLSQKLAQISQYGLLAIGLVFFSLFILEIKAKAQPHVIQYVLVGVMLCLYFIIFQALSEYRSVQEAFLIASAIVSVMIAFYSGLALRSTWRGFLMLEIMAGICGLVYVLLYFEQYGFMAISGFLLAVTVILMLVSVTINSRKEIAPQRPLSVSPNPTKPKDSDAALQNTAPSINKTDIINNENTRRYPTMPSSHTPHVALEENEVRRYPTILPTSADNEHNRR